MVFVSVSLLSFGHASLEARLKMLEESAADSFHMDLIDGQFSPVFGLGHTFIQYVRSLTRKPLEFHLMITDPYPHLQSCKALGAKSITVHAEGIPQLYAVLQAIKALGCEVGVALSPHTAVSTISETLYYVDRVLLLSVNPGWGGQEMLARTFDRVAELKALIDKAGLNVDIEIDGGVTLENAPELCRLGARRLVGGAVIARADEPIEMIAQLKDAHKKSLS